MLSGSVSMSSLFCEQIVPRIPGVRINSYSTVHTTTPNTTTPKTDFVGRDLFPTETVKEMLNNYVAAKFKKLSTCFVKKRQQLAKQGVCAQDVIASNLL